jgi:hypothetical protein
VKFVMGETPRGRKLHAVVPGRATGSWAKALCGVDVIVYANVSFDPDNVIPASVLCRVCKKKAA